jgi:hypothetical protein
MRPVTRTRELATFDELTDKAQQKAITEVRAILWEQLDSDYLSDALAWWITDQISSDDTEHRIGALFGRNGTAHIEFSLAYSQSDHVRIVGKIYRADADRLSWPNDPEDDNPYIELPHTGGIWYEPGQSDYGRYLDRDHPLAVEIHQLHRDAYRYLDKTAEAQTDEDAARSWISEQDRPRMFDADGMPAPYSWRDER